VALPPAGDYPVTAEVADGLHMPTRFVVRDDGRATLAIAAPDGATVAITLLSASPAT
jgi:hypothetical protein